jgi:hypothetical protein
MNLFSINFIKISYLSNYSTVTDTPFIDSTNYTQNNDFYYTYSLKLSVVLKFPDLWKPPYNYYQQFLFNTINQMHTDGSTYLQISNWLNENNYLTPRGSAFQANHAWSMHVKKLRSIERFARTFEPVISDMAIDII